MVDTGWWPKCRAGPTGATFPSMTFTLTWPRAVAPVRFPAGTMVWVTCPAGQVQLPAANLTLVLGKIGLSGSISGGAAGHRVVLNDVRAVVANAAANFSAVRYPAINGPL